MPSKSLRELFERRHGPIVDRAYLENDFAFYLTNGKLSQSQLKNMDRLALAVVIAEADSFTSSDSRSFTEVFGVSSTAMAIQLVDLSLIS